MTHDDWDHLSQRISEIFAAARHRAKCKRVYRSGGKNRKKRIKLVLR